MGTRQLTEWRLSESRKSKSLFDRFMQIYWSQQGKRKGSTMIGIIKRDQKVYAASLRNNRSKSTKVRIFELAKRFSMSEDNVKDVLKFYGQFYERWRSLPDTRIYLFSSRTTSLAILLMILLAWVRKGLFFKHP